MKIHNILNEEQLQTIYLDWVNNYLTVEVFAEHYGLTEYEAHDVIDFGREAHEMRCAS